MHEARHQSAMASSSGGGGGGHQPHQQPLQLRHAHHQPPPLSHGVANHHGPPPASTRGPSPPHHSGGLGPHLPISGSSVSYSDDSGSFNMLAMPFDDSSSHLDLPSLLQANGGRDMRLGVALDHHGGPHLSHNSAWPQDLAESAPSARRGGDSKPQPTSSPGTDDHQLHLQHGVGAAKKRGAADAYAGSHHGGGGFEDAPKPARTKKKKTSEKNTPLDDTNEALDDDFDGLDGDGGEGGGSKDVKRQMRLVKNRQAAQQFRKRQKQYIQDLEKRCSALAAQNASYGAKVELLTTENRLVKEQLEYLRSFVSQAVQVSLTPAAVAGGPLQMPGPLSAALAGAIPAPLLGMGSPLAGALSSSLPSQTGPGRPPSFAALQSSAGPSSLGSKMPSFPSPISLSPSSSAQRYSAHHQPSLQPSPSPSSSSASAYTRGHHTMSEMSHRPL